MNSLSSTQTCLAKRVAVDIPRPYRPIDTSRVMPTPFLRACYQRIQPAVEALFGFPKLWRIYDAAGTEGAISVRFTDRLLRLLRIRWQIDEADLQTLRARSGPLIVVANHPFGGADSLAFIQLLETLRPGGWRMLSNQVICSIPEFRECLIAVDPLSSEGDSAKVNRRGLAAAARHLREGGVLGFFPAGRVSHWNARNRAITDRPWTDHAVRLAQATGAEMACLHIPGQNSRSFLRIPPRWSRFRALMLCRELTYPRERTIRIRLAALLPQSEVKALASQPAAGAKLRAWCYLHADADTPRPQVSHNAASTKAAVGKAAPRSSIIGAIEDLRASRHVFRSGKFDLLLIQGRDSPVLLQELGRIREITFRAAAQGTGNALDLAPEDEYYHHLLLWDHEQESLAGAYRIGIVQEILKSHGPRGLYLDHIFKIRPDFYRKIGPAFELSRSFVLPDYQRDTLALASLWKGLGHSAVKQGIENLFGSVTISNHHHPASRALLVEHLRQNFQDASDLCAGIRARNPFRPETRHHRMIADAYRGTSIDSLAPMIHQIEGGKRGIPPLMRYYCSLGAKFLGFHVEPSFADALYCLLRVDLHAMPSAYQKRFLGIVR